MTTNTVQQNIDEMLAPMIEFNNMLVEAAETTFNMQIASFQAYSKLGIDNINEAMKIRSTEEMTSFAESQKDLAKKVSDMMTSDAKAFSELSTKFYENAKSLAEGNVKKSVEVAKSTAAAAQSTVKAATDAVTKTAKAATKVSKAAA